MSKVWAWFQLNWKSNTVALVAIIYGAQQFVTAVTAWEAHQTANWRSAVISLIVSAGFFVTKDATTNSTLAQVTATQAVVDNDPRGPAALVKANAQVVASK